MQRSSTSTRAPSALLKLIFRLPVPLLRARMGWMFANRVVLIEHVGRRTGLRRQTAVEVIDHDPHDGSVTVASGYGHRADWYRNLIAQPRAAVILGRRRLAVDAQPVEQEQGAAIMVRYARRHPRAAPRVARMLGYVVDGTDSDYAELGRAVRFVVLKPHRRQDSVG